MVSGSRLSTESWDTPLVTSVHLDAYQLIICLVCQFSIHLATMPSTPSACHQPLMRYIVEDYL